MDAPVYIQIHNAIRADIEAGKWRVGDRIPSERDLAVTFKVSRMTLRQAIQTLVDEGILERRVRYLCCQPESPRENVWRHKLYGSDASTRQGAIQ